MNEYPGSCYFLLSETIIAIAFQKLTEDSVAF